jgi:hypothetical protein
MNDTQEAKTQSREASKARSWMIVTFLISLTSGGAMGSIITHYFAARQTIIRYFVNTTSLGAGMETKNLLPTLKLQLNSIEIPVVYTHTVEFTHASGPELDGASLSITVEGARLLGSPIAYGPDPVHKIACNYDPGMNGIVCSVGRMTSNNSHPYKIIFATDQMPHFAVAVDGKNTIVQHSTITSTDQISTWDMVTHMTTIALGLGLGGILILVLDERTRPVRSSKSDS